MTESLDAALTRIRQLINDRDTLVRAVASGRRRGWPAPVHMRTEFRPVALKTGIRLQITRHDGTRPITDNVEFGDSAVDVVLAQPYGNWLVETVDATVQLRVTKRGEAQVHRSAADRVRDLSHDRTPPHLIAADDPLFTELGAGAAKRRQVDAFLRAVAPRLPDDADGLHVVDLGCGNAYLTFAMYRHLTRDGRTARVTGVDIRDDQRHRNTALAGRLGWSRHVDFIAGSIADAPLTDVDVVLALHACDTATDDALARGVQLGVEHIFAAPCCHHDIAGQLRAGTTPEPYAALTGDGILRERFADVLTDALRASLLRLHGYRVDVVEFIDSAHTPRNTLIRAVRTTTPPAPGLRREYRDLVERWGVRPHLAALLGE